MEGEGRGAGWVPGTGYRRGGGEGAHGGLEDLDVRAAVRLGARLECADVLHLLERHGARLHVLHAARRQLVDEPAHRARHNCAHIGRASHPDARRSTQTLV